MVKTYEALGFVKPKKGRYGIEVELEEPSYNYELEPEKNCLKIWKTTHDDSLNGGVEFLTKRPLPDTCVTPALKALEGYLQEWSSSVRTAVHIHYNAHEMTAPEVYRVFLIYTVVEKLLLRYCGPEREGNLFCLPNYDCPDIMRTVRNKYETGTLHHVGLNENFYKYSAFNLETLGYNLKTNRKLGTFEFRSLKTPSQDEGLVKRIQEWVRIITKVVEFSETFKSMGEVFEYLSESKPRKIVTDIFGAYTAKELVFPGYESHVTTGKRLALLACKDLPEVDYYVPTLEEEEEYEVEDVEEPTTPSMEWATENQEGYGGVTFTSAETYQTDLEKCIKELVLYGNNVPTDTPEV